MTFSLLASLSGPRHQEVAAFVSARVEFSHSLPTSLWINNEKHSIDSNWRMNLLSGNTTSWAHWDTEDEWEIRQINVAARSDVVSFGIPNAFSTVEEALAIVEPLSFELGILGAVFFHEWIKEDYPRWGIGRSNVDHGWGCIFRGAGHDRLVSRRWLDFGPWRVIRRPNDTTVIQFHDLAITDPAEAYEQARAGHQRMGNSPTGGYIAWHLQGLLKNAGKGLYFPESRTLEVVVAPGLSVSQGEMLGNAALRLHHRLTRTTQPVAQPIEHIAYIFIDEADARAHLHELWLRELQCWAFDAHGVKHRLDLDYHPVPDPPAWVRSLDGR